MKARRQSIAARFRPRQISGTARRERIIASQRHIPPLEWCVVILGGIVTVGLTYVFVFDDLRIQVTLTAMVALSDRA